MLARRLTPVLLAVVLAGLAAAGCASQAVGVRVGDRVYSQPDLMQEIDALGESEAYLTAIQASPEAVEGEMSHSYVQAFAGYVARQRVIFMLVEELFEQRGLELDDAELAAAEGELESQMPEVLEQLPDEVGDRLVDDLARYNIVAGQLGAEEFEAAMDDEVDGTEIEVSSRIGEWDDDQFAVAPLAGSTPPGGPEGDPATRPVG